MNDSLQEADTGEENTMRCQRQREIGVMLPQAEEYLRLPELENARKSSFGGSGRSMTLRTP